MAILSKKELLTIVERSIQESGAKLLFLNPGNKIPAQYMVTVDQDNFPVDVYIWNISHGGKGRSEKEFRIQVTGVETFSVSNRERTAILGYYAENEIFVAYDPIRHSESKLGHSPSMQINKEVIVEAKKKGLALYQNAKGESVVAFKPGLLASYLHFQSEIHKSGETPDLLKAFHAAIVDDTFLQPLSELPSEREFAISSTRKAIRASDFRSRVLGAYGSRCAICGMQIRLIDAAHILPVSIPSSTDETSNGVALCALHHRAYDNSLITFRPDYKLEYNKKLTEELVRVGLDEGLEEFLGHLPVMLQIPVEESLRPKDVFVDKANKLRGWAL